MKISDRMERKRKRLGKKGERIAAGYLKKKGLRILEKNYSCEVGEVDLIAAQGDEIIFVEVKTRSSIEFGWPEDAVDKKKQKRIHRTAHYYLGHFSMPEPSIRFDIISILENPDTGKYDISHIVNAF